MSRMRWMLGATAVCLAVTSAAAAPAAQASGGGSSGWAHVPSRETVVSSPVVAGGYPGPRPAPGGCVAGPYDANFSESALALRPGSEQLVGGAKAYFDRWST